jgi:acetyl-CoA synthetase
LSRPPSYPALITCGLQCRRPFIAIAAGHQPDRDTALSIFRHIRTRLAPYKRVRRIAFAELPKTISGKIRRVELRRAEAARHDGVALPDEYREEDFKELDLG